LATQWEIGVLEAVGPGGRKSVEELHRNGVRGIGCRRDREEQLVRDPLRLGDEVHAPPLAPGRS
jgi:hypothetical protein